MKNSSLTVEKEVPTKKLSIVVIAYNMARELPRTIRSLSNSMQENINVQDYEVILVDNGSTEPFDEYLCRQWIPELNIVYFENPTPSPVNAINYGISIAKGDLVGVFIDGARMASPGLLSSALLASKLYDRPVIGTLAFHLGPDTQMKSIKQGYNQLMEDRLLESSGWEDDGYQLFSIAKFAGASRNGWFVTPNESNALFLKREHWTELNGYNPEFVTPGGGLCNHDMWRRACFSSPNQVVMLLGEATFHQVHGGVSTNAVVSLRDSFRSEYADIKGEELVRVEVPSTHFGSLNLQSIESMKESLDIVRKRLAKRLEEC